MSNENRTNISEPESLSETWAREAKQFIESILPISWAEAKIISNLRKLIKQGGGVLEVNCKSKQDWIVDVKPEGWRFLLNIYRNHF